MKRALIRSLWWALAIAQALALVGYSIAGTTLIDGLRDTATRATWAFAAWLLITAWASIREPKPASPTLAPSPDSLVDLVRKAYAPAHHQPHIATSSHAPRPCETRSVRPATTMYV